MREFTVLVSALVSRTTQHQIGKVKTEMNIEQKGIKQKLETIRS